MSKERPPRLSPADMRAAARDTAHPIPEFHIPPGWYVNVPMEDEARTETSLRSGCWCYHIDVHSVAYADETEGPYWAELKAQVGGEGSFETHRIERLTRIEPGGLDEAIIRLVAAAYEHREERESDE